MAIEKIRREDRVLDIADFLDESFGVTITASTESGVLGTAEEIATRAGIPNPQLSPPRSFPLTEKSMKALDWQILKALRYDALRSTREITRDLGVSYRMTHYSINKLFESNALSTRAIINAKDPKGVIFYSLNLLLDSDAGQVELTKLSKA